MAKGQPSHYDEVWDEVYGDLQDIGPTHRHMKRLMRTIVAPLEYRTVLEVGVGFGHNLPVLTEGRKIERLTGVDVSERALEHVRGRWSGEFHKLDITVEQLPDTWDLVCCALVMEHVVDDATAFSNLRAMTGKFLLVTTIAGPFERYRPWEAQMGHVRNYARGELERKLASAGFQVVRSIYWGYPFYSPIARTLQNRMTATPQMSTSSRAAAQLLYLLFFLNSRRRGDLVLTLARPQ